MKFKIIINGHKDWAKKLEKEIAEFLGSGNLVAAKEDVTILIGGDGTIFYNRDRIDGAIFAIGGEQSKVCQATQKDWKEKLGKTIKKFGAAERTALSAKVNGKIVGWAINDAVVHSRKHNFIELDVKIGKDSNRFGGDGIIVATATGASGYAYSAGGFLIGEVQNTIEVVPICPYLRAFRPALVPALYDIEIRSNGAADLILDGQQIIELGENAVVSITGDRTVRFAIV